MPIRTHFDGLLAIVWRNLTSETAHRIRENRAQNQQQPEWALLVSKLKQLVL